MAKVQKFGMREICTEFERSQIQAQESNMLIDLEKEYLTTENFKSVNWNRENAYQVHRERAKNWPKIPKTVEECDSSDGRHEHFREFNKFISLIRFFFVGK